MKRFAIVFFLLGISANAQVPDSLAVTQIVVKEELKFDKNVFEDSRSQQDRNQQYVTAIQKDAAEPGPSATKKEIDEKLLEQSVKIQEAPLPTDPDKIIVNEAIVVEGVPAAEVPVSDKVEAVTEKQDITNLIEQLDDSIKKKKKPLGPSDYDTRIELLQLKSEISWQVAIFQKSSSVAMLIEKEKVSQLSKEIYTIDISQTLGKSYNLCPEQAFYEQPIVGTGTAFIFSAQSMITAKHVFERSLKDYIVIFGYNVVQANGVVEVFFDKNNLYYPVSIIASADDLDVVEFEVDRPFDRPALEWENSFKALKSATNEIYMIGHPCGLPMKVALNATIEKNPHLQYFYTTLDSYQGNSGSPVFNFYTHKVIGVLVSGEKDYKFNGNCYYRSNCIMPYCKGEKVIRIEEIVKQF